MRMRSQVVRMRSSSNMRMRITLSPELRMRITRLHMRIVNLEEIFDNLRRIGQKTEFITARPDHQNVKKIRKPFSVKIIVSKVTKPFSYLIIFQITPRFRTFNVQTLG